MMISKIDVDHLPIKVIGANLLFFCMAGCQPPDIDPPPPPCPITEVRAITVTKEEYKALLTVEAARPILLNGKIVTYQHYLFVAEPEQGIHIFDNSDPENPKALYFINVPDPGDFFIKDDVLYVQTLTDLAQLDISNIDTIAEIGRGENLFTQPYIYRYGYFSNHKYPVDQATHVIIGVEKFTPPDQVCEEEAS